MEIAIALDSFKGSLTSRQAGEAVCRGALKAMPDAQVRVFPLADGGEGTAETLTAGLGGVMTAAVVKGPLGAPVKAGYGVVPGERLAILEMAQASGLDLVSPEARDPLAATTYGVGELILAALHQGCRNFIIGLGGSATNDGGLGMLEAVGYRFYDEAGCPVEPCGRDLERVRRIDGSAADHRLRDCRFTLASDVQNPLCGPAGASAVYGPQKGADTAAVARLDAGLAHFAAKTADFCGRDLSQTAGAGAAGGLSFAFLAYLGAEARPGAELVMDAVGLPEAVCGADLVVTGEGRLDGQTAMGKAPMAVAKLAKRTGKPVIAFAGCAPPGARACNDLGIDAFFPILRMPVSLREAMLEQVALENLEDTAEQVFRLIRSASAGKK